MMDFIKIVEKVCNEEPMTNSELEALDILLKSADGRRRFKDEVERKLNSYDDDRTTGLYDTLEKIYARRINMRRGRRSLGRIGRWVAAAAVILAAGATFFLMQGKRDYVYPTYDGEFGSPNKAVLTLSDGRTIVMEEFTDEFVEENGAVVKVGKGELDYNETGDGEALAFHDIYIPVGGEYKLRLTDGTVVWLNSDTRLRYPMSFSEGERCVELNGEAYFAVTPDATKPFIVESAGQAITVLGTEFNVTAYSNEENIQTTLVSGSVRITTDNGDEMIITPGQQARLDRISGGLSVQDVDVLGITAWKDGYLVIEDQTLEQIMNKLARWYGVEYTIEKGISRDRTFRGVIPKYDIEDTLKKLEMISKLKLQLDDNVIKVKK